MFWDTVNPVKEILKNAMSYLYFNEESDYSEENKCYTEVFWPAIFQPFQFEPKQEVRVVMWAMRKKINIFPLASAADLLHVRIGNLNRWKTRRGK